MQSQSESTFPREAINNRFLIGILDTLKWKYTSLNYLKRNLIGRTSFW